MRADERLTREAVERRAVQVPLEDEGRQRVAPVALVDRAHPARPPDRLPRDSRRSGSSVAAPIGCSRWTPISRGRTGPRTSPTRSRPAVSRRARGNAPAASSPRRAGARRSRHRPSAAVAAGAAARKARSVNPERARPFSAERQQAAATAPPRPAPSRDVAPPAPVSSVLAPVPFGGVDPLYVMGSDGLLRTLRVSDGTMTAPMVPFLPPSARPSSLTFINGVIYTSTSHGCGAAPNGVWALDLTADNKVTTWRDWRRACGRKRRSHLRHRRHALRRDDERRLRGPEPPRKQRRRARPRDASAEGLA